jgi:fluoride exporter
MAGKHLGRPLMDLIDPTTSPPKTSLPAALAEDSSVSAPGQLRPQIERMEVVAVAGGGMAGALVRIGVAQALPTAVGGWPWSTFAVNLAGTLLLGCLPALLRRRAAASIPLYRLLGTGFCGAVTTFSTMQLELLRMLDRDRYGLAAGYLAASVVGGYLAVELSARLLAGRKTVVVR